MADYLNPQSMQPGTAWKPNGFLGGVMWNQYQNDYERLLAQAEEQRRLEMERRRQEQSEFMRGIPLRNQVQDNQLSTAQGQAPYLGQLAGSEARAGTAKNESFIRMVPTEEEGRKTEVASKKSMEELRKINAANALAANYLNQAMGIVESRGFMSGEAQVFLKSKEKELKDAGYNLPEGYGDPKNWQALHQRAMFDVQTTQELIKQREKDAEAYKRTDRSAQATERAAAVRASASSSRQQRLPRTPDEAVIYYRNIINDPETPEEEKATAMKNYQGAVTSLWQKFESSPANMDIQTLRDRASRAQVPAEREKAAQAYLAKRNAFFEQYGVGSSTPAERARTNPQPGTGTTPPPPSGFIVIK